MFSVQENGQTMGHLRGYYLSAEYLIGRHMQNAIANLDLEQNFKDGLQNDTKCKSKPWPVACATFFILFLGSFCGHFLFFWFCDSVGAPNVGNNVSPSKHVSDTGHVTRHPLIWRQDNFDDVYAHV